MKATVNEIKGLQISENTARLIASLRTLQDVYDEVYSVLQSIYGSKVAESLINDKMEQGYYSTNKAIQEFMMMVIEENLSHSTFKSI